LTQAKIYGILPAAQTSTSHVRNGTKQLKIHERKALNINVTNIRQYRKPKDQNGKTKTPNVGTPTTMAYIYVPTKNLLNNNNITFFFLTFFALFSAGSSKDITK
jgi:hypothetical protein